MLTRYWLIEFSCVQLGTTLHTWCERRIRNGTFDRLVMIVQAWSRHTPAGKRLLEIESKTSLAFRFSRFQEAFCLGNFVSRGIYCRGSFVRGFWFPFFPFGRNNFISHLVPSKISFLIEDQFEHLNGRIEVELNSDL